MLKTLPRRTSKNLKIGMPLKFIYSQGWDFIFIEKDFKDPKLSQRNESIKAENS